jgi:mono/diheme cytochrome c family protein
MTDDRLQPREGLLNRILLGALAVIGAALVAGGASVYSGAYNVAASEPHWAPTLWLLETARVRSIKAHASGIAPPGHLAKPERVVAGVSHYAEHCSNCHGGPGVEPDDMAEGMYPKPPRLTNASRSFTPGELFWILKNGIKMTGMPAWGDHSDDDLWNTVAFLEKLPSMTPDEYQKLRAAADAAGGHHIHQGMEMQEEKSSDRTDHSGYDNH